MRSRQRRVRNEGYIPSAVRLKKLLPTPVVSKRLTVENQEDTEMESQSWLAGITYLLDQPAPTA